MSMPSSRLRGRDDGRQPAGLELLLDLRALLLGHRAVVGPGELRRARRGDAPDCAITCGRRTAPGRRSRRAVDRAPRAISLSRALSRSASRRELANTIVERCASIRSTMRSSTCGQIDVRALRAGRRAADLAGRSAPSSLMSSTGTTTSSSIGLLATAAARPSTSRGAAEEAGDLVDRPDGRRQPDPLRRPVEQLRRAARATAPGARRAWCRRRRAPRRRSRSRRRAATRAPAR